MHALPVPKGVFGANCAVWAALPPDLRELLKRELPKLEADIWSELNAKPPMAWPANRGAPECQADRKRAHGGRAGFGAG